MAHSLDKINVPSRFQKLPDLTVSELFSELTEQTGKSNQDKYKSDHMGWVLGLGIALGIVIVISVIIVYLRIKNYWPFEKRNVGKVTARKTSKRIKRHIEEEEETMPMPHTPRTRQPFKRSRRYGSGRSTGSKGTSSSKGDGEMDVSPDLPGTPKHLTPKMIIHKTSVTSS